MSAKQIPNLNTLRRGGGGLRGRLRNRGGLEAADASADDISTPQKHKQTLSPAAIDGIIQGTDNDASASRLSAVDVGYLHDDFARALTPAVGGPGSRRFPIINRGTYVRTVAIDDLVNRFLDSDESQPPTKKQIISLGAGSDTRPFRILGKQAKGHVIYHEIDFPANTSAKIRSIRASPLLQAALQVDQEGVNPDDNAKHETSDTLHLSNYHIHAVDLRTLAAEARSSSIGTRPSATDDSSEIIETNTNTSTADPTQEFLTGINPALPTLIISECCLMYLSSDDADAVLDYFTYKFFPSTTPVGVIIYEPIRPEDAFGKTMISNLAARGIQLQTLSKYASLSAQRQRCVDHGFKSDQKAVDIDFVWNNWISDTEKRRVATLEMLDEIEEWRLLAQHYCMVWAWREAETADIEVFRRWKHVRSE